MKEKEGKIEKIEERVVNTKRGETTAYNIYLEGTPEPFSAFRIPALRRGETVKISYVENGNYKNVQRIEPASPTTEPASPTIEPQPTHVTAADKRDIQIALQVCMKCVSNNPNLWHDPKLIMRAAIELYDAYVMEVMRRSE